MSRFITRFGIPLTLAITMCVLAVTLTGVVIARSPYTHANLSSSGYSRTDVAYVGQDAPWQGMALANPNAAKTGDAVQDGRALFFAYGCASCHGLNGQGQTVGKTLQGDSGLKITSKVREGPKTMPAFSKDILPDTDLQKIIAFLNSAGR